MNNIIIIVVFGVLMVVVGIFNLTYRSRASRKQKELLQIQAEKRGGRVDDSVPAHLFLTVGKLVLQIYPVIPEEKGAVPKTHATLGADSIEMLAKETAQFPRITIITNNWFQKKTGPSGHQRFLFGEEDFDKVFSVYAEHEADVHRVLTSDIRRNLLALSPKSPSLKTVPDSASERFFSTVGAIKSSEAYDLYIDTAVSILKNLA